MLGNLVINLFFAASMSAVAQMELPPGFDSQTTRIEIKGFGGRNKGEWRLAGPSGETYTGRFTRSETRLGVFDPLVVRNKGRSSFTITGPAGTPLLSAECAFRKVTVNIDIVTFDAGKLAYQCEFSDAGDGAWLAIGEPKREGLKQKFLANDLRRGEAQIFGEQLTIDSVHGYAGSKFTSQPPVGYVMRLDDQYVGAVELTDKNPGVYLAPDLPRDVELAVYVASLAIAVLRDPADSALED